MNNNTKKVNLVPSSYFLEKKLKVVQIVALCFCSLIILFVTGLCAVKHFEVKAEEKKIAEANKIIAEADFATLESLKTRYETLLNASDAGNFNTIPNIYEDMTDFLTCIVSNMPECMSLDSINGEFTGAGVYSYTFEFKSSDRAQISPFLQKLQNEEILKFVNISAISLQGGTQDGTVQLPENNSGNNSGDITDDITQQDENGLWAFSLVIKTKGGA